MEYSQLVDSIAFILHESWKQSRKTQDGNYEKDWQPITDENYSIERKFGRLPSYIRQTEQGSYEIDRANTAYKNLPSSMKRKHREFANYIAQLVDAEKYRGPYGKESLGKSMHKQCQRIYAGKLDSSLDLPYEQLDKKTQEGYASVFDSALQMSLAKDGTIYVGNTIDNIVRYLMVESIKGNNVYYEGFGTILFSKFDNEESCYLKAYGKSKGEVYAEKIEREQREAQTKARVEAKIPEWRDRGFDLIYYKKSAKWVECVKDRAHGLYLGHDLEEALQIMEGLESGMSFDKANQILKDSGHTGASYSSVMKIIVDFSKKGPAFFRHVSPTPLSYETEKYIQEVEIQNDLFKKLEDMNAERYAAKKAERAAAATKDDSKEL